MNLRGRLFTFISALLITCMFVASVLIFMLSEKLLVKVSFENLTQARISKSQVLKTEFEQLSRSLTELAAKELIRDALLRISFDFERLEKWTVSRNEEARWRRDLIQDYASSRNPEALRLINKLPQMPVFLQSRFSQTSRSTGMDGDLRLKNIPYFASYDHYFPVFAAQVKELHLNDVLLISRQGKVIFSVQRGLEFGSNLVTGPFNSTALGDAFRWAQNAPVQTAKMFDFKKPLGSFLDPVAYLATPLHQQGQFIGAVLYQISVTRVDQLLSDNFDWQEEGLKNTGEVIIFGTDGLLRSNLRLMIENPDKFAELLRRNAMAEPDIRSIMQSRTTALHLGLSEEEARSYLNQDEIKNVGTNNLGIRSVRSAGRLTLPGGEQWIVMGRIDYQEAVAPLNKLVQTLIPTFSVLLLFSLSLTYLYFRKALRPIQDLVRGFSDIESHHHSKKINYRSHDELGQLVNKFNKFSETLEVTTLSKNFLTEIVQSVHEFLFVANIQCNPDTEKNFLSISEANQAVAKTLGVHPESMKGTELRLWLDAGFDLILKNRSYSKEEREAIPIEGYLKPISSEPIPVTISWSRAKFRPFEEESLVIVCSDRRWKITAESEIKLRDKRLRETQSLSKIGVFEWEIASGITYWTEEVYRILGLPLATRPSQELMRSLILSEDVALFDKALAQSRRDISSFNVDIRIRQSGSSDLIWLRCLGKAEYSNYGVAERMFGTYQDITSIKKTEQALINSRNEALKASQAKSEFLAHMSHEIRTPMNSIMGVAELLLETKLDKDQKYYIDIFRRAGESLMTLIDDILDLSKIEAGEVSIENIPFDLENLLADVAGIMRPKAQEKGLLFHYEIGPGVKTTLMGDPTKLRQIFMNLIGNSLKFTERGHIHINVIRNPTKKNGLIFSVIDTGYGIPATKQHLIFQKFTQADSSITNKFGGTGLGLAICKSLVELMGGQIWFKSRENVGTSFFFTLPYREQILNPVTQKPLEMKTDNLNFLSPSPPKNPDRKIRILLADDTEDNRTLFVHFLKNGPYEIVEAENGLDAFNKIKSNRFDIVFMDVQMPDLDGYAATAKIREWEREQHLASTPIIALTAHALSDDKQKSLRAGCNDHLTKPFKRDTILEAIYKYSS